MKRLSLALGLAASMWACDGSTPTSPIEPPPTTPPRATYTLSGVVTLVTPAGQAPSEGALVQLSNTRQAATTDKSGSYSIHGVSAGPTSVTVSAYACAPVSRDVTIDGNTILDVQVAYRSTFTLSGVVSEVTPNGLAPVEGVKVHDSYFHAETTTDIHGFYRFEGPFGGLSDSFGFTKEGYQDATHGVTINGNTRLDVQLVRR